MSEATHALTRHRFAFEPAGELALRGKAEPMVVHRLLGALAEPRSARGLAAHGLASPMVGRTDELEQLLAAFDRMQRGRAQVVSLVGEAGTGKSRLIAEFLRRARGRWPVRPARPSAGPPARPWASRPTASSRRSSARRYQVEPDDSLDVARQKLAAGLRSLGAPAEVAEAIAPVLSYLLGVEEERPRDFEPEQLKRQIALAARTLVERRLEQGPLLLARGGSPLGRRGLGGPAAGHRRPPGGPAPDDAVSHRPDDASAACRPGCADHHPARPALPERDQALVTGLFGRVG